MISPTCIMISLHGTQIAKNGIPHGTEHPTVFMISPRCIMISPETPHVHGTAHPHGTAHTSYRVFLLLVVAFRCPLLLFMVFHSS